MHLPRDTGHMFANLMHGTVQYVDPTYMHALSSSFLLCCSNFQLPSPTLPLSSLPCSRTMKRPSSGLVLLGGSLVLLAGGVSGQGSCVQVSNVAFDPAASKLTFQMEGETTVVANTVSWGSEACCINTDVFFLFVEGSGACQLS